MSWSNRYVEHLSFRDRGRGWGGVDCWGLVHLAYREELGIELPSFADDYVTSKDRAALDGLIRGNMTGWEPVKEAKPFDVVLMRIGKDFSHVGLVVRPGLMVHCEYGCNVIHERYDGPRWKPRVINIYRKA